MPMEPARPDPSDLNDLIEELILRTESDPALSVEGFLSEHPAAADALRVRIEKLRNAGLIRIPSYEPDTRYQIIRELGRGGQGVVYLARDGQLGRQVALKVLTHRSGIDEESSRRLRREARSAARLNHPSIATVYDFGEMDEGPFIAMQFIEGQTLAEILELASRPDNSPSLSEHLQTQPGELTAPSPEPIESLDVTERPGVMRVLRIMEQTARAVHVAHEAGLIHRDLKPGNIMVTPDGQPVILDFGLARDLETDQTVITQPGQVFGSPLYMSPEQIRGTPPLDRRTDIWALGVTLFQLLTRRAPFQPQSRIGIADQIQNVFPPLPHRLNPVVPKGIAAVVETSMAKSPDERYPTALAFAEDLRRIQENTRPLAKAASWLRRIQRSARRYPATTTALAATATLITILVVVFANQEPANQGFDVVGALVRRRKGTERPGDVQLIEKARAMTSDASWNKFEEDPNSAEAWEILEDVLPSQYRAGAWTYPKRLVYPRAGITELRPTFSAEVDQDTSALPFILALSGNGEAHQIPVALPAGSDTLTVDLPSSVALRPGCAYVWTVKLDAEKAPDYAGIRGPAHATFLVVDSAVRDRILQRSSIGHVALDKLLVAAELNVHQLASDALELLGEFPADATDAEKAFARYLRAEAHALLGNRKSFYALKNETGISGHFAPPAK